MGWIYPGLERAAGGVRGMGGPPRSWVAVGALLVAVLPGSTMGQSAPLEIERLRTPIRFDGMPDDAAWQQVDPLPLTMYFPTFGGTPEQRTEIRVAYDDEYFYAAGWFYDDDPAGIRINSLYRDRWNGDDAFAIYIDSFNDNQNAQWFGTTPSGMRFDLLVSDDGVTLNDSWDTFWDSRTRVTANGWFAEVRIPFSSIGFQADAEGRAVMGLTVTRLVSRTAERVTFPAIDPRFQFRQPSVAQDIVLRDVRSPRPLYATPYALAGASRQRFLQDGGVAIGTDDAVARDIGLDLRYAISGNLGLDVTVNTDFAQVEADDEQVNLDRFPLFFPEKRRFFQERSGIFEFTTGSGGRLFHSRRIGLTDGREPVPVAGGARMVGRLGVWDVGLLDMQTESLGMAPSENFGVARAQRRLINENSFIGAMATTRTGGDEHNIGAGIDGTFRVIGDHYLTTKWSATFDSADPDSSGVIDRSNINARWQHRTGDGLAYTLEYVRSGRDYDPDLGFLPRRDFTTANVLANWYRFAGEESLFRRIWPGLLAFSTFRNGDGALESGQYAVWVQWETKAGGGGWIEPKLFRENVAFAFPLGDAEVPAGDYTFADLQINLSMPTGRRLRTDVDFRAGTYFDGTRQQITLTPVWNVSPHVELGGEYRYSRIRFDERGQKTDIHLARLRVRTALDARASGNAFVQYNSTSDRLDFNVRLRYNFAEGTDLWLVYNEGLNTERDIDSIPTELPLSASRSLILKYSYTFAM